MRKVVCGQLQPAGNFQTAVKLATVAQTMLEPAAVEAAPPASDQAAAGSAAQAAAGDVAALGSPPASQDSAGNQAPDSAVSGLQCAPTEGDTVHGGPPGSRSLVLRNMQASGWLRNMVSSPTLRSATTALAWQLVT